jgi:hypothetical protein
VVWVWEGVGEVIAPRLSDGDNDICSEVTTESVTRPVGGAAAKLS